MEQKGIVFDIQRFSLNDGPGIRTTIFLKGCPLNCAWCHNPESIDQKPQLAFIKDKCVKCGSCEQTCSNFVHKVGPSISNISEIRHEVNFPNCLLNEYCVDSCNYGALKIYGQETTSRKVVHNVIQDAEYYLKSGGGVTLSGGEPLMQYKFSLDILKQLKNRGIHTCLDTSGFAPTNRIKEIKAYTDLFHFDFKIAANSLHEKYTGVSNVIIVKNLLTLAELQADIILRCPIIPGINDTIDHVSGLISVLKSSDKLVKSICEINLLPYHGTGNGKQASIGREPLSFFAESVNEKNNMEFLYKTKELIQSELKVQVIVK